MKILITGGLGFIGSHVADIYLAHGHDVILLDDLSTGREDRLPLIEAGAHFHGGHMKFIKGSILDKKFLSNVFEEEKPDVINHHAAQISVTASVVDPINDAQRNVVGTATLLQVCRDYQEKSKDHQIQKLIYATSGGAMYGAMLDNSPHTEDVTPKPESFYGLSKHTAERYVWLASGLFGLKATVLRYANVYGPRQDPHGEAGVCAIFAERMLKGEPVSIFGDGTQVRDYVFVGDVAKANYRALTKGDGQAYNICRGVGVTTKKVFEVLKKATEYNLPPNMAPARPGEIQEVILSPKKAITELGWKPSTDFKAGIDATVKWYKGV